MRQMCRESHLQNFYSYLLGGYFTFQAARILVNKCLSSGLDPNYRHNPEGNNDGAPHVKPYNLTAVFAGTISGFLFLTYKLDQDIEATICMGDSILDSLDDFL
ncbi:MAG: hypothetical protein K0Q51_191 [Rickettsiaceae bacterium]|jgi:hypothetical protein|nr:hypothetical protein [Rickettsiaceae bacterium]